MDRLFLVALVAVGWIAGVFTPQLFNSDPFISGPPISRLETCRDYRPPQRSQTD